MTSGGHQERNATSGGSWCISKPGGTIDFYTYDSADARDADLQYGQGCYATKTDSAGVYWLIRSYAAPALALKPLEAFGFVVTTMKQ